MNDNQLTMDPSLAPGAVERGDGGWVMDRVLGFLDLKTVNAAAEFDLFEILAAGPKTVAELAAEAELPERSTGSLLHALTGMHLVEFSSPHYLLTERCRKYYLKDSPFCQLPHARYMETLFAATADLNRGLKEDRPIWSAFAHYLQKDSTQKSELSTDKAMMDLFNNALTCTQIFVSHTVFPNVDLSSAKAILDVGGNHGRYIATALSRFPNLTATNFDLPEVTEAAKKRIAVWGFSSRVHFVAGDFMIDPWPPGHDVISLTRILNSRTRETIDTLFRKAYDALPSGGRLIVVHTPMLPSDGNVGRQGSRMALLHFMASQGHIRTGEQWAKIFTDNGFDYPSTIVVDDPHGFLMATKP